MAETIHFEAIKPDGHVLVEEAATEVIIPGAHGYFGVRKGHDPFLTTLGIGEVAVHTDVGITRLMVSDGFCEVSEDRVVVLAETAERADDIDVARAERSRDRATERIQKTGKPDELDRARSSLKRSEARLKVAQSKS